MMFNFNNPNKIMDRLVRTIGEERRRIIQDLQHGTTEYKRLMDLYYALTQQITIAYRELVHNCVEILKNEYLELSDRKKIFIELKDFIDELNYIANNLLTRLQQQQALKSFLERINIDDVEFFNIDKIKMKGKVIVQPSVAALRIKFREFMQDMGETIKDTIIKDLTILHSTVELAQRRLKALEAA